MSEDAYLCIDIGNDAASFFFEPVSDQITPNWLMRFSMNKATRITSNRNAVTKETILKGAAADNFSFVFLSKSDLFSGI